MRINDDRLWLGSDDSYWSYTQALTDAANRLAAGWTSDDEEESDPSKPYLVNVHDGVAVIDVKGKLTNRTDWWLQYMGMTSYSAIREALVYAATNPEVKSILLDVDSGGGTVSGVADTANLIRMIHNQVKPVEAFTDGGMMSAAYWLGVSAGKVHGSKTSMVGSIGVISTHVEASKQMKDEGLGVTVIRGGKYKALANPYEPLSEEGKKQIEAMVGTLYNVFVEHVATMRGRSFTEVDEGMAQGREFAGVQALQSGLVDSITTFDALMQALSVDSIDQSRKTIDNAHSDSQGLPMKRALTNKQIEAAALAGVTLDDETAAGEGAEGAANAGAEGAGAERAGAEGTAEAGEGAEGAAGTDAEAESTAGLADSAVTVLQAQVKDLSASLVDARVQVATLQAQVETMIQAASQNKEQMDALAGIVGRSLNTMRVAMNQASADVAGLDPKALVAEHTRLSSEFSRAFKAGGVAAVTPSTAKPSEPARKTGIQEARVNAARVASRAQSK